MFSMRNILAVLFCGVLAVVGLRWFMKEGFDPFVATAREKVRESFEELVDKCELQHQKAKMAVEEAREKSLKLRLARDKAAAQMRGIDGRRSRAEAEIAEARQRLVRLEQNISGGKTLRLVSGRAASPEELGLIVEKYRNSIQLAEERAACLDELYQQRQQLVQRMDQALKSSPVHVQRLQNSVDFLAGKLELYRDLKDWTEENPDAGLEMDGLYAKAERILEEAHAKIDVELNACNAIFSVNDGLELQETGETTGNMDEVLASIRSALGSDPQLADLQP